MSTQPAVQPVAMSTDVQTAVTLAAIAYADEIIEPNIKHLLGETSLATGGDWDLVWGPHKKETNQAFMVKKKGAEEYALAIRGTVFDDLFSWLIDFELELEDLPWSCGSSGAKISDGMVKAWKHITTMPDLGTKLPDVLKGLPAGASLVVTGHSQGGAVASVMATWAQQERTDITVLPYTFAGETAGNDGFAALVETLFGTSAGGRFVNPNDVVPFGFGNLTDLPGLYKSVGVIMPPLAAAAVATLIASLSGDDYTQPLDATVMPNAAIYPPNPHPAKRDPDDEFAEEVIAQHDHLRYVWSTGAPTAALNQGTAYEPPAHLDH